MTLLAIEALSVRYAEQAALRDVSLRVAAGEVVGLVGPSGSGKSTLAMAIPRLLGESAAIEGVVQLAGVDLATLAPEALRRVRGGRIGMVFQEPATALNPARTIGQQIGDVLAAHAVGDRHDRGARIVALLTRVGLAVSPDRYPHMLSGGQRQRVAIAMAIAAAPALLVADEPTAALDPLARGGIVALLARLVREEGMGLLLVSHDLPLVARMADRIAVLDGGRLVEEGPAVARLADPASPALAAMVRVERVVLAPERSMRPPLLEVAGVARSYPASGRLFERKRVPALADVSLSLAEGETLAVVGASGSGKTTLARLILGLDRPDAGTIRIDGQAWSANERRLRRCVQAVFQDPADSLDPTMTVAEIVAEPLHLLSPRPDAAERAARVAAALEEVGLDPAMAARRPQAFSGGQRQRIALARALVVRPKLVVLDEALSALDPALRGDMARLLARLQATHGTAFLFVSHDMALVRQIAHRVMVLHDGRVVAEGPAATLLAESRHPAVAALAAASPTLAEALVSRSGGAPFDPTIPASPPR